MKAPVIRRELSKVLGLPDPDGVPEERVARRAGGVPPSAAIADIISRFVTTLNSGDAAAMRAFIADHFTVGGDAPTAQERMERLARMRQNLGALTLDSAAMFPDGPAEVRLTSAVQGQLLMKLAIDRAPPHRIGFVQVILGG